MKVFLLCLFVVLAIFSGVYAGVWDWNYTKNYEYSLKLSDDSSLPGDKAKYLEEYLNKVSDIKNKPRYFFMTPDLELSKQIVILQGLITRFDDIAKIKPSEMAYQQGMQQLTGQEMDHQLQRITNIFRDAKMRESFFSYFNVSLLGVFIFSIGAIVMLIWLLMTDWI